MKINEEFLRNSIRTIQDYPVKNVAFKDITTLLGDAAALSYTIEAMAEPFQNQQIYKVAGIESRGFILGGAIAAKLNAGFIPIRKKGKLPYKTVSIAYSLEYGIDEMEMHSDALQAGEKILIVDDIIATGGSAIAATKLLHKLGAEVIAAAFIINLPYLNGSAKLKELGVATHSLLKYDT
ncbi:adenine phosphoribosyltransferase [Bartonella sp. TP]|uniref:adenine phosphoribosyltransferase n=1 Tax=Bartonella sp. TP TaxID=3057550 RepID=UPI0025AEFAB1|nr:adenine phosphoribosyltransferase [Bartonella sp. TP]WJW79698.1 adenine phosphoribosyltransferase [Bartonella sp. TP]